MRTKTTIIIASLPRQNKPVRRVRRITEVFVTGACILAAACAFFQLWYSLGPFHALWMSFVVSAVITTTSLLFAGYRPWNFSRSIIFIAALATCGAALWNIMPASL